MASIKEQLYERKEDYYSSIWISYQQRKETGILRCYGIPQTHVTLRATSSNVPPPPDVDAAAPDGISTTDITHALDYVGSQQTATNVDVCEGGSRPTPVINQPPCTAKKPKAKKIPRCQLPSEVDEQIVGELQKLREQAACKYQNESDPDRQFLLSLLPLMKQLSPVDSIEIEIKIHQAFRRKLVKDQNSSYGY